MLDKIYNLKRHLRNQIDSANILGSDWVYIRKIEAEKCLELAEAEEVILEMYEEAKNSQKEEDTEKEVEENETH